MTTANCASCLGHCGRTALTLWAVVFVALLCVTCPKASAAIEPSRGAGAEFELLESRTRHDHTVLVATGDDSTDVSTVTQPASAPTTGKAAPAAVGATPWPTATTTAFSHSPRTASR